MVKNVTLSPPLVLPRNHVLHIHIGQTPQYIQHWELLLYRILYVFLSIAIFIQLWYQSDVETMIHFQHLIEYQRQGLIQRNGITTVFKRKTLWNWNKAKEVLQVTICKDENLIMTKGEKTDEKTRNTGYLKGSCSFGCSSFSRTHTHTHGQHMQQKCFVFAIVALCLKW